MAILINIGLCALFIYAVVKSCFIIKRYKELRNYTFWTEQSLLQYRPDTYIPVWRKQQREKDRRKKNRPDQNHLEAPDIAGDETISLNKLLSDRIRY
jgi:hypothetical protein